MIDNIIKYYKNTTDLALKNLSQGKKFYFNNYLNNSTVSTVFKDNLLKINKSSEGNVLINDYLKSMNNMGKIAQQEYNQVLQVLKSTDDMVLKQKILNDYADNGITGFINKKGARWNIETYSNMYSRHVNNQLIRLEVMQSSKSNLFLVSTHKTKCHLCKPYEGRTMTKEQLNNSTLFHPNCLHFITEVSKNEYESN